MREWWGQICTLVINNQNLNKIQEMKSDKIQRKTVVPKRRETKSNPMVAWDFCLREGNPSTAQQPP